MLPCWSPESSLGITKHRGDHLVLPGQERQTLVKGSRGLRAPLPQLPPAGLQVPMACLLQNGRGF